MFIFLLFLVFMNLKLNLLGVCFHCQLFLLNCKLKPMFLCLLDCGAYSLISPSSGNIAVRSLEHWSAQI